MTAVPEEVISSITESELPDPAAGTDRDQGWVVVASGTSGEQLSHLLGIDGAASVKIMEILPVPAETTETDDRIEVMPVAAEDPSSPENDDILPINTAIETAVPENPTNATPVAVEDMSPRDSIDLICHELAERLKRKAELDAMVAALGIHVNGHPPVHVDDEAVVDIKVEEGYEPLPAAEFSDLEADENEDQAEAGDDSEYIIVIDKPKPRVVSRHKMACLIPSCGNSTENTDPKKVRFHRIPDGRFADKREQYYDACGLFGPDRKGSYICTDHFTADEIDMIGKKPLRRGAMPTLYLNENIGQELLSSRVRGPEEQQKAADKEEYTGYTKVLSCIVPSCSNTTKNTSRDHVKFVRLPSNAQKHRDYLTATGLPDNGLVKKFICTDHFEPEHLNMEDPSPIKRGTLPTVNLEWNEEDLQRKHVPSVLQLEARRHWREERRKRIESGEDLTGLYESSMSWTREQNRWIIVTRFEMEGAFNSVTTKTISGIPCHEHLWREMADKFNEQFAPYYPRSAYQLKEKTSKLFTLYYQNSRTLANSKGKVNKVEWFDLMDTRFRHRSHPDYQQMMAENSELVILPEVDDTDMKPAIEGENGNNIYWKAPLPPFRKFALCHDLALIELIAKHSPYSVDITRRDSKARTAAWQNVADDFNEQFEMPVEMDITLCKKRIGRLIDARKTGILREKPHFIMATEDELQRAESLLDLISAAHDIYKQSLLDRMNDPAEEKDGEGEVRVQFLGRCAVSSCHSRRTLEGETRFFWIPSNPEIRAEYSRLLKKPLTGGTRYICSLHYTEDDFTAKGKLRRGVLPSIELPELDSEPYDETTYPVANLPKTADEEEASGSADHEMAQAVESIQAGAHNAQLAGGPSADEPYHYTDLPIVRPTKPSSYCVIPYCPSKKSHRHRQRVNFFRCPPKPNITDKPHKHELYRQWVNAIGNAGGPTEWTYKQTICSAHFMETEMVPTAGYTLLVRGAYPTRNLADPEEVAPPVELTLAELEEMNGDGTEDGMGEGVEEEPDEECGADAEGRSPTPDPDSAVEAEKSVASAVFAENDTAEDPSQSPVHVPPVRRVPSSQSSSPRSAGAGGGEKAPQEAQGVGKSTGETSTANSSPARSDSKVLTTNPLSASTPKSPNDATEMAASRPSRERKKPRNFSPEPTTNYSSSTRSGNFESRNYPNLNGQPESEVLAAAEVLSRISSSGAKMPSRTRCMTAGGRGTHKPPTVVSLPVKKPVSPRKIASFKRRPDQAGKAEDRSRGSGKGSGSKRSRSPQIPGPLPEFPMEQRKKNRNA